jgi:hypothetical protein
MVDVTNRPHVHMRLRPLKLFLRHLLFLLMKGQFVYKFGSWPGVAVAVASGGDDRRPGHLKFGIGR